MTPKKNHGGRRPGAGRPRNTTGASVAATESPADVLAYLVAVALGNAPADAVRVQAAKAALPYVSTKCRAPLKSPPPKQLQATAEIESDADTQTDWQQTATQIRARHNSREDQ